MVVSQPYTPPPQQQRDETLVLQLMKEDEEEAKARDQEVAWTPTHAILPMTMLLSGCEPSWDASMTTVLPPWMICRRAVWRLCVGWGGGGCFGPSESFV